MEAAGGFKQGSDTIRYAFQNNPLVHGRRMNLKGHSLESGGIFEPAAVRMKRRGII
jgi:hypothetical protein